MQSRSAVFSLFAMILALVLSLQNTDVTLAQSNEPLPMPTAVSEGAGRNPHPILPIIVPDETEQNIQPTAQPDQLVMPDLISTDVWRDLQLTPDGSVPLPRQIQAQTRGNLTLIYENDFSDGLNDMERLSSSWMISPRAKDFALQLPTTDFPTYLTIDNSFSFDTNSAMSFSGQFRLNGQNLKVGIGRYTVRLKSNGTIRLFRDNHLVAKSIAPNLMTQNWLRLQMDVEQSEIRIHINGDKVLSFVDSAYLGTGTPFIQILGQSGKFAKLDRLRVWAVLEEKPALQTSADDFTPLEPHILVPGEMFIFVASQEEPYTASIYMLDSLGIQPLITEDVTVFTDEVGEWLITSFSDPQLSFDGLWLAFNCLLENTENSSQYLQTICVGSFDPITKNVSNLRNIMPNEAASRFYDWAPNTSNEMLIRYNASQTNWYILQIDLLNPVATPTLSIISNPNIQYDLNWGEDDRLYGTKIYHHVDTFIDAGQDSTGQIYTNSLDKSLYQQYAGNTAITLGPDQLPFYLDLIGCRERWRFRFAFNRHMEINSQGDVLINVSPSTVVTDHDDQQTCVTEFAPLGRPHLNQTPLGRVFIRNGNTSHVYVDSEASTYVAWSPFSSDVYATTLQRHFGIINQGFVVYDLVGGKYHVDLSPFNLFEANGKFDWRYFSYPNLSLDLSLNDPLLDPNNLHVGQTIPILARITNTGTEAAVGPITVRLSVPNGLTPQQATNDGDTVTLSEPVNGDTSTIEDLLSDLIDLLTRWLNGGVNPLNLTKDPTNDTVFVEFTYQLDTLRAGGTTAFEFELVVKPEFIGLFTIEGEVSEISGQNNSALESISQNESFSLSSEPINSNSNVNYLNLQAVCPFYLISSELAFEYDTNYPDQVQPLKNALIFQSDGLSASASPELNTRVGGTFGWNSRYSASDRSEIFPDPSDPLTREIWFAIKVNDNNDIYWIPVYYRGINYINTSASEPCLGDLPDSIIPDPRTPSQILEEDYGVLLRHEQGFPWTEAEISEIYAGVTTTATAFGLLSDRSESDSELFKIIMTEGDSIGYLVVYKALDLPDVTNLQITFDVPNVINTISFNYEVSDGGCKVYEIDPPRTIICNSYDELPGTNAPILLNTNAPLVLRGASGSPLGNKFFTQYVLVHELGHIFDTRAEWWSNAFDSLARGVCPEFLKDRLPENVYQEYPNGVDELDFPTHCTDVVDINGWRLIGVSNNGYIRRDRGWGSGPDTDLTDFQQHPGRVFASDEESTVQHEEEADMFLNWVYRKISNKPPTYMISVPTLLSNNTFSVEGLWLGFHNLSWEPVPVDNGEYPNDARDDSYPGDSRFEWANVVLIEVFKEKSWTSENFNDENQ